MDVSGINGSFESDKGAGSRIKLDPPNTLPFSSVMTFLYHWYELNLIAILGTIPTVTAPRPLYRASQVSRFTISRPVVRKPRALACSSHQIIICWQCKAAVPRVRVSFSTIAYGL